MVLNFSACALILFTRTFYITNSKLENNKSIIAEIKEGQVRCGEHSDYGTLTLLFQDLVGGLEVNVYTLQSLKMYRPVL